jgi:predicted transcriptional regulator of viral defense system
MKYLELNNAAKLLFGVDDIAKQLSISKESARVTAVRYVQNGILVRLKRDLYILSNSLQQLNEKELFRIANLIQVPSYVSLTTALSYYNISNQQLQNVIESVALKRTKSISVKNLEFNYSLIKKDYYCGFELVDNFFIAVPEKALADAVYLTALKRYNCDFEAISFKKLDKQKVVSFLEKTNAITKQYWSQLCKTYKI